MITVSVKDDGNSKISGSDTPNAFLEFCKLNITSGILLRVSNTRMNEGDSSNLFDSIVQMNQV